MNAVAKLERQLRHAEAELALSIRQGNREKIALGTLLVKGYRAELEKLYREKPTGEP